MFYIYILKSLTYDSLYVGSSENPEKRLIEEHNKGKVRYTKGRMPWVIVHKENFRTRSESVKRERFLKSGQGRKFIKNIIGS